MTTEQHFLVIRVQDFSLCLPLSQIDQVTAAAALRPSPGKLFALMGLLDLGAQLVPVLSCHQLLGLEAAELHPKHRFVVVRSDNPDGHGPILLALHVDDVQGLINLADFHLSQINLSSGAQHLSLGLLSDGKENLWLFDLQQLLQGVDIKALEALRLASG